jgi:hypothetical protein
MIGFSLCMPLSRRGNWSDGFQPGYGIMGLENKINHTRRLPPMSAYHKNVKQSNKKVIKNSLPATSKKIN